MPQVYLSRLLRYADFKSDKVWGGAVLYDEKTQLAQFVSAWGKYGATLQHKRQIVQTLNDAKYRFAEEVDSKLNKGYADHFSPPLSDLFYDLAAMPLNGTQAATPPPKAVAQPVDQACGWCQIVSSQGISPALEAARCTVCKREAIHHVIQHPHGNPTPPFCKQFSLSPTEWAKLGWNPANWFHEPKAVSAPGQSSSCLQCAVIYAAINGDKKLQAISSAYFAMHCVECNASLSAHAGGHPHWLDGGCAKVKIPAQAYELAGWPFEAPADAEIDPSHCPNCIVNKLFEIAKRHEFYDNFTCERCNDVVGMHGDTHPHRRGKACAGLRFGPGAYVFANLTPPGQSKILKPKAKRQETEDPNFKLPDLPCDCSHWLNTHATQGELLDSGIELDARACLVMTCKCEAFRRTCPECREQTRTVLRHKASCLAGLRERMMLEPATGVPIIRPRSWREQRSISHLLLPDDDF